MTNRKRLQQALSGPQNMRFGELVSLVEAFGFRLSRTSASHHIYVHPQIRELVNLQNVGGKAKAYQVRQFLRLIERYNLQLRESE
jgi:predicted RNA binding protein YcfA (HicA-like mRNA interferase family)